MLSGARPGLWFPSALFAGGRILGGAFHGGCWTQAAGVFALGLFGIDDGRADRGGEAGDQGALVGAARRSAGARNGVSFGDHVREPGAADDEAHGAHALQGASSRSGGLHAHGRRLEAPGRVRAHGGTQEYRDAEGRLAAARLLADGRLPDRLGGLRAGGGGDQVPEDRQHHRVCRRGGRRYELLEEAHGQRADDEQPVGRRYGEVLRLGVRLDQDVVEEPRREARSRDRAAAAAEGLHGRPLRAGVFSCREGSRWRKEVRAS